MTAAFLFFLFFLLAASQPPDTASTDMNQPDTLTLEQAEAMPLQNLLSEERYSSSFAQFMARNRKVYKTDRLTARYRVFKSNLEFVLEYNSRVLSSANFQLDAVDNPLADETFDEFKKRLGFRPRTLQESLWRPETTLLSNLGAVPDSVDWRNYQAVTPVRDQGSCGSCYTFAAAHALEGALAIAGKGLTPLSTKHLLDCSSSFGNQGCNGGLQENCYKFIQQKGVCSDSSYPYSPSVGTCKTCTPVAKVKGYSFVSQNENALMEAAARQPIAIAIAASSRAFQLYKSGVFDQAASCGTNLDHAVTLVGYGSQSGTKYWLVKNSWGTSWGEKGYIRMKMGSNMCGLRNHAVYPTLDTPLPPSPSPAPSPAPAPAPAPAPTPAPAPAPEPAPAPSPAPAPAPAPSPAPTPAWPWPWPFCPPCPPCASR